MPTVKHACGFMRGVFFSAIREKLLRGDSEMEEGKYKAILSENWLEAAEEVRGDVPLPDTQQP